MLHFIYTNKQILLNTLTIIIFALVSVYTPISLADVNSEEKLYTQEGYPYGTLTQRVELVTIRYSQQDEHQVRCSAEITDNGTNWEGEVHKVSNRTFSKQPLKACLNRDLAKKILATTY